MHSYKKPNGRAIIDWFGLWYTAHRPIPEKANQTPNHGKSSHNQFLSPIASHWRHFQTVECDESLFEPSDYNPEPQN